MAEEKKLTNKEWCDLMNRIHAGKSCLTLEAQKREISLKELIAMGDEAHKGRENERWQEWTKTKRESARRDKQMQLRKRKPAVSDSSPASTPAPAPEPAPAAADLMEELLLKKEKLQRQNADCASSLEEAEAILAIRQGALKDAEAVLEKAEAAVQQAQSDVDEAETVLQQAQTELAKVQGEIQQVEQEIKEKTVYLVDPWFNGNLPEYGTFLSTVEMEGVKTQEVSEDYLPEASLEGVLLFDFVPDYKKARVFCGLVAQFELEETPYQLLVSNERVRELLKMYIGK